MSHDHGHVRDHDGHVRDHGSGDRPLEAITHVHGGAMVLDIGGSVGALHVVLDDEWAGRELFVASDADPAFAVHTGAWRRRGAGSEVTTALFASLEAGNYRILDVPGAAGCPVEVRGGELVEVDRRLSDAARGAPER